MTRASLTFKQADVTRAAKAVRAAGLEVVRTEITRDGKIVLVHVVDPRAPETASPYDTWKASHGPR